MVPDGGLRSVLRTEGCAMVHFGVLKNGRRGTHRQYYIILKHVDENLDIMHLSLIHTVPSTVIAESFGVEIPGNRGGWTNTVR